MGDKQRQADFDLELSVLPWGHFPY